MKELKPIHVVLFILGVFLILLPATLMIPKDGLSFGSWKIKFLTAENLMSPIKPVKKDISKIVAKVDTASIETSSQLKHKNKSNGTMGAPAGGGFSGQSATQLSMGESGKSSLAKFFQKIEQAGQKQQKIHILHYGDSQIEGDRMTAYIRQRLQNQFGGNGPGLIPAMNVYNTMTFKQSLSTNFSRYTCFGGSSLKNRKYGALGSAARFTPEYDSSSLMKQTEIKEAWIEIEPGKGAYSRAQNYNNVKMHYNSCFRPCGLKVYQNGKLIHEDSLITDGKAHNVKLDFGSNPGKLKFVFNSAVSPTITGFSLEGDYGIQVSNVAMRGSSGTIFGKMDQRLLSSQYSEMNVEMIIMQFGGNSVPYFKDSSSVRNFVKKFKGQLTSIKKIRPSAAIVVIGPSDMSKLDNGVFITYPFLPYCVDQLRKAAIEIGGAYWDLFGAMGGVNSMPSWVEQGLAGRDYIHFSNKGSSIASQLFFDALGAAYTHWKQQNP